MKRKIVTAVGWLLLLGSLYLVLTQLQMRDLLISIRQFVGSPHLILLMTAGYGAAFWLRSMAWSFQMGSRVSVSQLWYYHHIGLLLNHLLPVKGGELARAALLRTNHPFSWGAALLSVGASRLLDIAGLLAISAAALLFVAPGQVQDWYGESLGTASALVFGLGVAVLAGYRWITVRRSSLLDRYLGVFVERPKWFAAFCLTVAGWSLEAVVVWSAVIALKGELSVPQALLVHVLTIIGQTFHVTPGGIGTYEAVMSALLHEAAGHPMSFALQVAIVSHGYKFFYSFVVGGFAAWRLSLSPLAFFRRAVEESKNAEGSS
ncbi:lysylphosphatidylglycerol synthase transmembrane domain-containing protein [Brevibacillus sp. H7]|uniref:lysylphosphatidylglycerol synthase transmembrane domain-containing protein n=1 Tax=Brevibacillus sp. H7 TaxID=3349138 RepID=UPI00381A4B85